MRTRIKNILSLSLPVQILLIGWASAHPAWVERWYSRGVYPWISRFFRALYGWVPFSVGDLLYGLLFVAAVVFIWKRRHRIRRQFAGFLRDLVAGLAVLHATFYLLWGLNYFREPLSNQLDLDEAYTQAELIRFCEVLTATVNRMQSDLVGDSLTPVRVPYSKTEILNKTVEGYEALAGRYPQFRYIQPSLKKSLMSTLLTYMGYGGYLNPFTGEAQVNARLPEFRFPVVSGHEVGHQLGYSAENETNFIGYLVSLNHSDPYFRYSASAYALSYCLGELERRDPEARKAVARQLNPGVRTNYEELQTFWESFQNPMEPVFKAIFNRYLEANRQQDGIASYNRVVSLMIAYHREEAP